MKSFLAAVLTLTWTGALFTAATAAESAPNTLTAAEKAAGWRLLWDGQTMTGWRLIGKPDAPGAGWVIGDGWLTKVAGARGGNIITTDQFTDFELSWEWRIPKGANNGVKYFIVEARGGVGHEYQMWDDGNRPPHKGGTASFYDVLPPKQHAPIKLAPAVNHSRVIVRGDQVEHWLNGEKVLEYECGSPEVLAAVAKSKFKGVKDFGRKQTAHLLLTDHGSECSYRNVKLRELKAP